MTPFKPNITKSIDNLNILNRDLHLVYGDELETNIDNMLVNNVDEKTGSNLTYNNTVDNGKLDFDIIGNCEQDSYSGKNQFAIPNNTTSYEVVLTKNNNGTFNISGTATGGNAGFVFTIDKALPSGTYTLWKNNDSTDLKVYVQDYNGNIWVSNPLGIGLSTNPSQMTATISPTGNRTRFFIQVLEGTQIDLQNVQIQLEEGNTATAYEPYVGGIPAPNPDYPQDIKVVTGTNQIVFKNNDNSKSQTYTLHLGNLELCKIGDYSDKIVKTATGWNVIKNIGKVAFDGNAIADVTTLGVTYKALYKANYPADKKQTADNGLLFEKAKYITKRNDRKENCIYENERNVVIVGRPTDTLDTLKAKFNGSLLYYILDTPVETPITDTTLIADSNAIYNDAVTYEGQTNIITESDAENAQILIDVSLFVTEKEV